MHRIHLNRTSLTFTIWILLNDDNTLDYQYVSQNADGCSYWLTSMLVNHKPSGLTQGNTLSDDKMDWHLTGILLGVFFYVLFQLYRSDITTIDVLVKEAFPILRVENEFSSKLDFD